MTHEISTAMPMAEYLSYPAVSARVISAMIDECPMAAWFASHLNPSPVRDDSEQSDRGSIAHKILVEGSESGIAIIDPRDHPAEKTGNIPDGWTNKSIRQARELARASGLIPILASGMTEIRDMVAVARGFVASLKDSEPAIHGLFAGDSHAECTIVWEEDGISCKMRPDLMARDGSLVVNYKTTQTSVHPDRWGRGPFLDYYVGAGWYRRGLRRSFDVEAQYVFLVQSVEPPYLCSLVGVDPRAMTIAESKCEYALSKWRTCVEQDYWPAYAPRVAYPELPSWIDAAWEEQQMREWK